MGNTPSATTRKLSARYRHSGDMDAHRLSALHSAQPQSLDEEFNNHILRPVSSAAHDPETLRPQPLLGHLPSDARKAEPTQAYTNHAGMAAFDRLEPFGANDDRTRFSHSRFDDDLNELNERLINSENPNVGVSILSDANADGRSPLDESMGYDLSGDPDSADYPQYQYHGDDSMEVDSMAPSRNTSQIQGMSDHFSPHMDARMDTLDSPDHEVGSDIHTPDLSRVDFTRIMGNQPLREPPLQNSSLDLAVSKRAKHGPQKHRETVVPVEIKWTNSLKEDISRAAIIGSFSNWRDVVKLDCMNEDKSEYSTTVTLPLGVHKLIYIINNEYRVSDQLPTATDQEGIFFNWFEVIDETHLFDHVTTPECHQILGPSRNGGGAGSPKQEAGRHNVQDINRKSNKLLHQMSKESGFEHVEYVEDNSAPPLHDYASDLIEENRSASMAYVPYNSSSLSFMGELNVKAFDYVSEIPEMFVNYDYFKAKGPSYELPKPPQLPAHLNNVLLNKMENSDSLLLIPTQSTLTNIPQIPTNPHQAHHPNSGDYHRPPLRRAESSYYASNKGSYHQSIPNHVILNHLMTTSIRNEVLTVACITRYSGKFITQIMHSPAEQ